jgi:cellulose synthase/poly-beta-1,6-N-acetylglucosamine synthase-like glycosyltransferase
MAHSASHSDLLSSDDLTRVCVVIPARNERLLVGRCISSVLSAGVPAANVFVVNDCSSDDTGEVLAAFDGINVLTNERRLGKSLSLQALIARFDIGGRFAFMSLLDADSYVARDYFREVLRTFSADRELVLVCGAPRSERHNWMTAFRAVEYQISAALYRPGQNAVGAITVAPGCAATYRTCLLGDVDWHGGTLVEDMDLTVQVHRRRLGKIGFAKDAIAYTQDPQLISDYVGQITRWHSGTWQVMRRHKLPLGGQRIDAEFALLVGEGLIYSTLMMLFPLLLALSPGAVWRWVVLDQLMMIAASAYCAAQTRRLDVLFCAPLYVVLRAINSAVFLKTFWSEVVCRRDLTNWFSVQRYHEVARIADVATHTGERPCAPSC